MLTLAEIRKELQEPRIIAEISRQTGINPQQLYRIKSGKDTNPTNKTMEKISNYMESMK